MNKVTPFLMFNDQLEAAIEFYTATFPNSEARNVARSVVQAVKELRAGRLRQPDRQVKWCASISISSICAKQRLLCSRCQATGTTRQPGHALHRSRASGRWQ